ncbi:MAG: hypothetical protein ABI612_04565 [Betaproteobacteria bacterium]
MKLETKATLLAIAMAAFAASSYAADPPPPVTTPHGSAVTVTNTVPVTVTSPVTINSAAPLRTTEAYPRTPVRASLSAGAPYVVPADQTLVIETVFAKVACPASPGVTPLIDIGLSYTIATDTPVVLPIVFQQAGGAASSALIFKAVHSVRIALPAGTSIVSSLGATEQCGTVVPEINIFGYLMNSVSPSLAP